MFAFAQELMELAGNAFNGAVVSACLTATFCLAPWHEIFADPDGSCSDDGGESMGSESQIMLGISSAASTPQPDE